ncbi:M15 family metallopeptidase [Amycolatopsis sp. CA-230715]|uniref:M15 family metallopeptidase n=1 Tax=Amycolatopsis sp. CA-230715 TaxID=2745196 RepID=UPI001C01D4C2|nr:M15 family metallopeptidase [Amycolatopsis sp. CA-230715]QWF79681.1 D-alanyl-D-alanine dipeptidase [Amycolatopsis sp. CA-230715]
MRTFLSRAVRALALVGVLVAVTTAPVSAAAPPAPSTFVALHDVDPTIRQDIRYSTMHNFVGRPVRGYYEPMCILTRPAAEALRRAQAQLLPRGYSLKVYDCYRPQRAVTDFVRWAERLRDRRMKAEFYPNVDKSKLFEDGYIAAKSGHSRGSTMDLTLVKLPVRPQRPYFPGEPLRPCFAPVGTRFPDNTIDMGTGFDCFDPLAHTDNPAITGAARENRQLLKRTLEGVGMTNLPEEWWHYTLKNEPYPDTYFDFPVRRGSPHP